MYVPIPGVALKLGLDVKNKKHHVLTLGIPITGTGINIPSPSFSPLA